MKKLYKIDKYKNLVHYDYYEERDDDDTDEAYKNRLTKRGLNQFIKDEIERLFGRPKNIVYAITSSKGHSIDINRKQFFQIIEQMDANGVRHLTPYYDDNDEGVSIHVDIDEDKKQKTRITLSM